MTQMIKVELVWQEPTPKLEKARGVLPGALRGMGHSPYWQEWRKTDSLLPRYLNQESSLALFVDGRFATEFKVGFYDEASIREVIRKLSEKAFKPALREPLWRLSLSVLPARGLALLPKCPLCWASYMSAMSALGLGTVAYQPWLLPALVVMMGLSIAGLFYQAWRRNSRYGPALLALAGALLVAVGKTFLDLQPPMYAGLLMPFVAAVWGSVQEARRARPRLL